MLLKKKSFFVKVRQSYEEICIIFSNFSYKKISFINFQLKKEICKFL